MYAQTCVQYCLVLYMVDLVRSSANTTRAWGCGRPHLQATYWDVELRHWMVVFGRDMELSLPPLPTGTCHTLSRWQTREGPNVFVSPGSAS